MFPVRANGETFRETTMFPQQYFRNNVSSFAGAFTVTRMFRTGNYVIRIQTQIEIMKFSLNTMARAKSSSYPYIICIFTDLFPSESLELSWLALFFMKSVTQIIYMLF